MEKIEIIDKLIDKLILSKISKDELDQLQNLYKQNEYKDYIKEKLNTLGAYKTLHDYEFKKKLDEYHAYYEKPSIIPLIIKISSIAAVFFIISFFYYKNINNRNTKEVTIAQIANKKKPKKAILKHSDRITKEREIKKKIDILNPQVVGSSKQSSNKKLTVIISKSKSKSSETYYKLNNDTLNIFTKIPHNFKYDKVLIRKNKYYILINGKEILLKKSHKKQILNVKK